MGTMQSKMYIWGLLIRFYGKSADSSWLGANRLKRDTLTSFSSIVLSLLPIVFLFLDKYCQNIPDLVAVVRLFTLMYTICGILASGAEEPMKHTNLLRRSCPDVLQCS